MVQEWLRFTPPQFPGSQWVAPVLGTIVFLYGGRPFLEGGLAELRSRQPGMMLLISLAILVAFGASVATLFGAFDLEFWWELALLIVIMLLGHWLEMRALGQASSALDALAALLPDEAERVTGRWDRDGAHRPAGRGRPGPGPPGRPGPGRRRGRRRRGRAGRVDDHRRVPPGAQAGSATRWWRERWSPTRPSGSGWTRSGRRPPWPGSAGWSSRPRAPARAPRPWPTGRPRCCSTSPPAPASSPWWCGCSWASPTRRSSARSRCW